MSDINSHATEKVRCIREPSILTELNDTNLTDRPKQY